MTELNLHRVKITYDVVVAAEDEDDAYFVARDKAVVITSYEECSIESVKTIESLDELHPDWISALPYGGNNPDELTCYQILESKSETKKKELIESLSDEQKYQLLSTLTIADIVDLIHKKEQ